MNVDELVRATLRRKLACCIAVLCALGAAVYGFLSSSVTYESSAVAVVYPPGAGDIDAKLNPFVNLNDNMAQLAAVTATLLESTQAAALVEQAGAAPDYTVTSTLGDTASALRLSPQLSITTTGDTPEAAQAGAQALLDFASVALAKLQVQTGVRPNTEASITTAVSPGPGSVVPSSPVRSAGAYGLAVLVLGTLAIVSVGTVLDRKRRPVLEGGRESAVVVDGNMRPHTTELTSMNESEPSDLGVAATRMSAAGSRVRDDTASTSERDSRFTRTGTASDYRFDGQQLDHDDEPSSATIDCAYASAADDKSSYTDMRVGQSDNSVLERSTDGSSVDSTPGRAGNDGDPSDSARTVRPPERVYSASKPRPPSSLQVTGFDPFNVPVLRDPRAELAEHRQQAEPFPARNATPVQELEINIDDYYGVEDRVHVPITESPTHRPVWSASRGPRR